MTESEQSVCYESEFSGEYPSVCPLCGASQRGAVGNFPPAQERRVVLVEFLYIDLAQCKRSQEVRNRLEEVVLSLDKLLLEVGIDIRIRKKQVRTEAEARKVGLISSPTIRLNGRDIQPDVKESLCDSCSEMYGELVSGRVWEFRGNEYTAPPKAMLIDAILRSIYTEPARIAEKPPSEKDVPDNLKKIFAARQGEKSPKWDRRRS